MYNVKMHKLLSTHKRLRTDEVVGIAKNLPKLNERFNMFAESLTEGGLARWVSTSPVQNIMPDSENSVIIKTENSIYQIDYEEVHDFPEE